MRAAAGGGPATWYLVSMARIARPAAAAALALALLAPAAAADTTNAVFPLAGPVAPWRDDYGAASGGRRQAGNTIPVRARTPVVAVASGRVQLLWQGRGGWSVTLTTPTGDRFTYLHLGRDGDRRTAYAPGLRDGALVRAAQRLGWSGASGAGAAARPQLGFEYRPRGGPPVDPFELLRSARRLPAARTPAPTAPGRLRLTGVLAWSARGDRAGILRVRGATVVRDGTRRRVARPLVLALPAGAAVARAATRVGADALVPGLRVTVWAEALAGGALVAQRVRIEPDDL
jgi:hypothetical protein